MFESLYNIHHYINIWLNIQEGFCIEYNMDDFDIETLCKILRVTSEWRKHINISHYKSL